MLLPANYINLYAKDLCEFNTDRFKINAYSFLECLKGYNINLNHQEYCDQMFWQGHIYETPFKLKKYVEPNKYMIF